MPLGQFSSGLEAPDGWHLGGGLSFCTCERLGYLLIAKASLWRWYLTKRGAQAPEEKPPIAFNSYNFPRIQECFGTR